MPGPPVPLQWTQRQVAVLCLLARADGPLYGTEIAKGTGMSDKHVYGVIARLRSWSLVAEANGPALYPLYRRRRYFEITSLGRREAAKRCGSDVPRETKGTP